MATTTHRRPDVVALLSSETEDEPLGASPDGALLWAVLERAVMDWGGRCLYGGTSWRQVGRYVTDAACWFGDDSEHAWSFVWICQHLQLDPGRTRDRLYHYIETVVHPRSTRAA